ncbi:hypothetical protein LWI29_026589 [Acer saccharum]|uniref:Uncharacterized protein n=1 Tax=Acer saccharum TaxID=4024 RepID=A0AA39T9M2_ACESA|nr:hypothetical protein LWI29_026589 [Acer saccharum]
MEHHREVIVYANASNEKNDKKSDTKRKERMVRRLPVEDGKGDINELADAFIKNFRNQLRIQREESFKRFQEMIARGV